MKALYVHFLWLTVFAVIFLMFFSLGLYALYDFTAFFLSVSLFRETLNQRVSVYFD